MGVLADARYKIDSNRPASDLEAFEWNTSMDLLACLTAPPDSTLSIYRLLSEEQSPKLLSEKITGLGTTLAWSPCGRKIAVGDRHGGITIYDSESGAVQHAHRLHSHPISVLSWVGAGTIDELAGDTPWSRMLPPLLAVPTAPSNMYAEVPDADVEQETGEDFTLLVSGDDSGFLVISAGGTFPLQTTQLFGGAGGSSASESPCRGPVLSYPEPENKSMQGRPSQPRHVASVRLSPDLRQLAVLFGPVVSPPPIRSPASPPARSSATPPQNAEAGHSAAMLMLLDVRRLAIRRRELAQCTAMTERLLAVIGYVQQGVETLGHVWRGAANGFANKMRGLEEAMDPFSEQEGGSVHQELLMTCCTGHPSDAVHTFLVKQTSPQQLSRLERALTQALEYVSLTGCTRLQVAGHHIITSLSELHACAGWKEKFGSIGLDAGPLRHLESLAQDFLRLIEQLILECAQAKKFVRVLFQVLLRTAHRLSEQAGTGEIGSAPSREDIDDFVGRMRRRESLELQGVTSRIGSTRQRGGTPSEVASASGLDETGSPPASLAAAVLGLATEAGKVGKHIVAALSSQASLLCSLPVHATPPWASVVRPEFKAALTSDVPVAPGLRSMGFPSPSIAWEALDHGQGARLTLVWCGGAQPVAELHLCRLRVPPAPLSRIEPELELARIQAGTLFAQPSSVASHFVLCQVYDPRRVAAVVLQEQLHSTGMTGMSAVVVLLDISSLAFQKVAFCAESGDLSKIPSLTLDNFPGDSVGRSEELPNDYVWASALRVMSTRGVCSVYAWRAHRLLTLDMEADPDEDEEDG